MEKTFPQACFTFWSESFWISWKFSNKYSLVSGSWTNKQIDIVRAITRAQRDKQHNRITRAQRDKQHNRITRAQRDKQHNRETVFLNINIKKHFFDKNSSPTLNFTS